MTPCRFFKRDFLPVRSQTIVVLVLQPTFLLTGVAVANEMTYCQMTNGHRYNIDSLLTFAVGGSPMRPELQKTITENLLRGRIPVKQVYGSSEQGVVANWTTKSDINTVVDGCVGKPAAGIEIRVSEKKKKNEENETRLKARWTGMKKRKKEKRDGVLFVSYPSVDRPRR